MANSAQARKRARQSETRRQQNTSLRSEMRTAIKKVRAAVEAGDKTAAQAVFQQAQATIDSIARKGISHANTASRTKSRLSGAIKAMA
jgi:small subunit ribosomal protein S20